MTSDPGHAKADKPRGPEAKTRRSKDGTWAKKGSKSRNFSLRVCKSMICNSYYGYKFHIKTDIDYGLIRDLETTTASVHDSQVDLTKPGEVSYRDKAYTFAKCKGFNTAMKRAVRDHPLKIRDKLRNKRIAKKRAPGERPFAVIKNVFKTAHTLLTAIPRVSVKNMFSGFDFNLFHLNTLKKQGHPATAIIK